MEVENAFLHVTMPPTPIYSIRAENETSVEEWLCQQTLWGVMRYIIET